MLVNFVRGAPVEWLLDPEAEPWIKVKPQRIAMIGTPVGLQPTEAIRAGWANKRIGAVSEVQVSALHNGEVVAFRLEWADAIENKELGDTTAFSDAAAVLLPVVPGAPVITMGAPGLPVNAWYWRADSDAQGREVLAEGIGSSRTVDLSLVHGHGVWKGGRWKVVISRALQVNGPEKCAQLTAGEKTEFAVAIWDGANAERGGIKAFNGAWLELQLAPVAAGGKV